MAKQVIYRRGTTAEHATFTGANGEITVDTVKHVVVVHDGVTAGGWPVANTSSITSSINVLTANAATQAASILALTSNAATQSTAIAALQSNAATQQSAIDAFTLASNATAIFANIADVRGNLLAAHSNIALLWGNATVQSEDIADIKTGVATFGNIVPSANVTYNLGSADYRWKDLYLSGNTIYLGASAISVGADGKVVLPGLSVTVGKADSIDGTANETEYLDVPVIIDQATYYLSNPDHADERGDFIPAVYAPVMSGNVISDVTIVSPGYYTTNIDQWSGFNQDNMWALPEGTALTWTDIWNEVDQIESVGNDPYGPIPFGVISTTEVQTATSGNSTVGGSQSVAGTLTVGGNIVFSDDTIQSTANIMLATFTMANSQQWTSNVSTIGAALNQLAARLKAAGF